MGVIWTIGHSTHPLAHFLSLLRKNGVRFLVDVRSAPYSRIAPQYDRGKLQQELRAQGIAYAFFGLELGGRPPERDLYDADGRVMYWAVARIERFQAAINRLLNGSDEHRIAVMCSEENPVACHRRLLVGRVLTQRGVVLQHIRGDGRIEEELSVSLLAPGLFGDVIDEERDWKSIRSVSHGKVLKTSSSESGLLGPVH